MRLADVLDLDARVPESIETVDDVARAEAVLDDASALVLDEGDPEWTAQDIPARARQIVIAVALRAWRNPDALTQSTVGDVSVSYGRSTGKGAVYLTDAEQKAVRRAAQRSFKTATFADPYPPRVDVWWPQ